MNGVDYGSLGYARNGWQDVAVEGKNGEMKTLGYQTFLDKHNRDQKVRMLLIVGIVVLIGGLVLAAVICGTKAHNLQPQIDSLHNQIPWDMPRGNWSNEIWKIFNERAGLRSAVFGYGMAIVGTGIATGLLAIPVIMLSVKIYKAKKGNLEKDTRQITDIISTWGASRLSLQTLIAKNTRDEFFDKCENISTLRITEEEKAFLEANKP